MSRIESIHAREHVLNDEEHEMEGARFYLDTLHVHGDANRQAILADLLAAFEAANVWIDLPSSAEATAPEWEIGWHELANEQRSNVVQGDVRPSEVYVSQVLKKEAFARCP